MSRDLDGRERWKQRSPRTGKRPAGRCPEAPGTHLHCHVESSTRRHDGRHHSGRSCAGASVAVCAASPPRHSACRRRNVGKIILGRDDLRSRQYGRGKLQAASDKREQVTETRPLPAHFCRPRPHRVDYPAGSIHRSLIHLRVSLQSDQQPIVIPCEGQGR